MKSRAKSGSGKWKIGSRVLVSFLSLLPTSCFLLPVALRAQLPNFPQINLGSINERTVYALGQPGATTAAKVNQAILVTPPPATIVIDAKMSGTSGDFSGITLSDDRIVIEDRRDGKVAYGFRNPANNTVTSTASFSAAGFNAQTIEQVKFADQFTDVDEGAKIASALSALPPTCGVVDARGLIGNQTIGSQLVISKSNCIIKFAPGSTILNQGGITITGSYVTLDGGANGMTKLVNALPNGSNQLVITGSSSNDIITGFNFTCGGSGTACTSSGNNIALLGTLGSGVSAIIIRNNRLGETQGNGTDQTGVGMGVGQACGIYAHNTNGVYIEDNFIFGNGNGICSDNGAGKPNLITNNNVMHLIHNSEISFSLHDGVKFFNGNQAGFSSIGDLFEFNGGWDFNTAQLQGGLITGDFGEGEGLGFANCNVLNCSSIGLIIKGNIVNFLTGTNPFADFSGSNNEGTTIASNVIFYSGTALTVPDAIIYGGQGAAIDDNIADIQVGSTVLTNLVRLTTTASSNRATGNRNSVLSLGLVTHVVNDQSSGLFSSNFINGIQPVCKASNCQALQFDTTQTSGWKVGGGTNGSVITTYLSSLTLGNPVGNINVSDNNVTGSLNLNLGGPTNVSSLGISGTTNQFTAGASGNATTANFPAPVIGNATLTFPNVTDTLVARGTTDTLTNKTLISPVLTTPVIGGGTTLTKYSRFSVALTPVAVAANTCASQSFTVTGIAAADILISISKPTEQAGLSSVPGHVTALNTATINFCNHTAASITPTAAETYQFVTVQ